MYSEEYEDPLYRKLSKILELTSLIFSHYKNTGQKERAHSLIVWVVSALQAVIEHRSLETYECCHHPYQPQPGNSIKISSGRAFVHKTLYPHTVRLAYFRAKSNVCFGD